MNDSKTVFALLRGEMEKNIAGCKDCGGSGCSASEWRELVKEMEGDCYRCHTVKMAPGTFTIAPHECNLTYPDLSTAMEGSRTAMEGSRLLIVDLMDRAGMWEGFVEWHRDEIASIDSQTESHILTDYPLNDWIFNMCVQASAEILTDGEYLVIAIRGYLEGRV